MEMELKDLGDNVTNVMLAGRLDTPGVGRIETRFCAALVPPGKHAIVDLSRVDFMSSMGIRMVISVARSLKQKQARLVLYAPQQMVYDVLESVSLRQIVPVCVDAAAAIAAVRA